METVRRHLRSLSLLAALALFALAFAPSISRARAASAGFDPLAELCSTAGVDLAGAVGMGAHLDHCPLCALGALLPSAPVEHGGGVAPLGFTAPVPAIVVTGSGVWAQPPSRGPPAPLRCAA